MLSLDLGLCLHGLYHLSRALKMEQTATFDLCYLVPCRYSPATLMTISKKISCCFLFFFSALCWGNVILVFILRRCNFYLLGERMVKEHSQLRYLLGDSCFWWYIIVLIMIVKWKNFAINSKIQSMMLLLKIYDTSMGWVDIS